MDGSFDSATLRRGRVFRRSQEGGDGLFSAQPLLFSAADFGAELWWGGQMIGRRRPFCGTPPRRGFVVLAALSELSQLLQAAVGKKFPQHLSAD